MTTESAFSSESGVPEPSVPEFTVQFVNASYEVTTKNPYTGLDETELISNNSIEITISNQLFDYSEYQLSYDVRIKPHFADNWTNLYPLRDLASSYNEDGTFSYSQYINEASPQSDSSYTIITFPVVPTELYLASGYDVQRYYSGDGGRFSAFLSAIPDGSKLDFQLKALVGHDSQIWVSTVWIAPQMGGRYEPAIEFDTASDWSETQTITLNESTSTTIPETPEQTETEPTQQDTEPETLQQTDWLTLTTAGALILIPIATGLGLLIYLSKRK